MASDLGERLRAKKPSGQWTIGSCCLSTDGSISYSNPSSPIMVYVNPDGPAAADRITELEAEVGRLRDALLDAQAESEMAQVLARDEAQSETLALIDRMTEGDGEYRVSLDPERHCPDECAMIIKIVDRFKAIRENAKQNNNLAKMYKAQADEFRTKYVAAAGGPD